MKNTLVLVTAGMLLCSANSAQQLFTTSEGSNSNSKDHLKNQRDINIVRSIKEEAANTDAPFHEQCDTNSVTDIDGNVYKTVRIGNQTWMAENLKASRYNDEKPILKVTRNTAWDSINTGAFCWYNDDSVSFEDPYGRLYNWYTLGNDKLCPCGWRIPSKEDWILLSDNLSGNFKESGFSALQGGTLDVGENYVNMERWGYWWSKTKFNENSNYRWGIAISPSGNSSFLGAYEKNYSSVRCIEGEENNSIDLERGLVAFYPFNGNANDESGNGHHGTLYGATLTTDRFGNQNRSYYFNGNNNKI